MNSRFLIAFCMVAVVLFGADPTGSIGGRVIDPSGAAIVGAKVVVTVIATGLTREATTVVDGGYIFPLLPAGAYALVVEASGFSCFEQRGIEVRANVNSTVPAHSEPGLGYGIGHGGSQCGTGGYAQRHPTPDGG